MPKVFFILLCLFSATAQAQKVTYPDTIQLTYINLPDPLPLEKELPAKKKDTSKVNFLANLSLWFAWTQAEKAVAYGRQGIALARQLGYKNGLAASSQSLGWALWGLGNYAAALKVALEALHLYEELKDDYQIVQSYFLLANIYRDFGDYNRALENIKKGSSIFKQLHVSDIIGNAILGSIYDLQNRLDSASRYVGRAIAIDRRINKGAWGWLYYLKGSIYRKQKAYDSAMLYYRTALPMVQNKDIIETYNGMALLYMEKGKIDSTIFYASEVLQKWRFVSYQRGLLQAATTLGDAYKKTNQRDSVIKYLELSIGLNNQLYNQQKERDIQNMAFNEQMRQEEIIREQIAYRYKLKMYALIGAGLLFLTIALLLYRNNKIRQKAYALLRQQKDKTEEALTELKATQQQLVQAEKMASLGELTAGIAHEIQNPLNFVNNFSETNTELIEEAQTELKGRNYEEVDAILNDIKGNEEKINQHGKRADAIVKGMLEHSRSSKGEKQATDINALVDEYFKLAYHGFRGKDKDFNAKIKTHFDETIGKVNIIPQDIGRVLLNLFNNAFYAVAEMERQMQGGYEPTVTVSTKKQNNKIEITVSDNGSGIPHKTIDKIFQPFFTTKPTGHGTGLGLSLSYDIVKAHGGELKVESKEGEGAIFTIGLPT